jgi:signal transduction histidine kinase
MFVDPTTGQKQSITTVVDITDRKDAEAKLAETYKKLADASRRAGMAEIATGVLHNVGNVVNSVNVSATLVASGLREMKIETLDKVCGLLRANESNLAEFLTRDPKGQRVIELLESLTRSLKSDRERVIGELSSLKQCVEHINEIVAVQQAYAIRPGFVEPLDAVALMEDALRMNTPGLVRCEIGLQRDFASVPPVLGERGKILQILINLIRNAKHACSESGRADKRIRVSIRQSESANGQASHVQFAVEDNGVGIPPENLMRLFHYGFTTRAGGHGFGLHSSVLAAREMNGDLQVESAGKGAGAKFTLELPLALAHAAGTLSAA